MGDGRVTVVGGTGFLGRQIVASLVRAGAHVGVAVRYTTDGVPPLGGDIEVVSPTCETGEPLPKQSEAPIPSSTPSVSTLSGAGRPSRRCLSTGRRKSHERHERLGLDLWSTSPGDRRRCEFRVIVLGCASNSKVSRRAELLHSSQYLSSPFLLAALAANPV